MSFKYGERRLVGSYLRVGLQADGAWRTYKLRQDFLAADKVQMETTSPHRWSCRPRSCSACPRNTTAIRASSCRKNCEFRLFQRPDEAIHPGFDRQTEDDCRRPGFVRVELSTPELRRFAQDRRDRRAVARRVHVPMRRHVSRNAARGDDGYAICSAKPRLVGGKPSKNPRYLQVRPDVVPAARSLRCGNGRAAVSPIALPEPVISSDQLSPVAAIIRPKRACARCVCTGRSLPGAAELFMDYVCSVTGKSPSTTGGFRGRAHQGAVQCLVCDRGFEQRPRVHAALVTRASAQPAGYIGPKYRVDHDISLLIPEIWCRLFPSERDPKH